MEKKKRLFSPAAVTAVLLAAVILMVIGSFYDFQLSQLLYNESNGFAVFFAAFGEYPAMLGLTAAGVMLLAAHNRTRRGIGAMQCIFGILLIVQGVLTAAAMPNLYLSIPPAAVAAIGIICSAAVVLATLKLCKGAKRREVIRVAAVVCLAILAEMILINIIKVPWGRARMRLVANDPRAFFMPWWQVGDDLKSTLVAAGAAAEEFKSFPSGHTGNAAMLMLLGLLPHLNSRLKGREPLLLMAGGIWAVVVAFTRIIMGAHYLTDTVIGFTVGFVCLLVVNKLVFERHGTS